MPQLQENCRVCLSDVDTATGLETKSQFQKQFGLDDNGVCFVKCDVAIKEDWQELWEAAEKLLDGPIDILVNNAGVHPGVCNLNTPQSTHLDKIFHVKFSETNSKKSLIPSSLKQSQIPQVLRSGPWILRFPEPLNLKSLCQFPDIH